MEIDSADISVMIQGPYYDDRTPYCIESVRQWLPGAEVILSTWRGLDLGRLNGLAIDTLALSDDPGGPDLRGVWAEALGADCLRAQGPELGLYNLNREILSSQAGLKLATRPYTLRLRSDAVLFSLGFLDYFDRYDRWRSSDLRIFKKRIVALDAFSPQRSAFCMYFADFCSFGLTEDVQAQWDIPLQPEPQAMRGHAYNPLRLIGEQYFWVTLFNKYFHCYPHHMYDKTDALIQLTEASIANNVVSVEFPAFGFGMSKYPNQNLYNYTRLTPPWWERASHGEWQLWARQHCGMTGYEPSAEALAEIRDKNVLRAHYGQFLEHVGLDASGRHVDARFAITRHAEFMQYCLERDIIVRG